MPKSLAWVFLAALAAAGCDREAPDLREWRATDHRHQTEARENADDSPQVSGSAAAPLPGLEEVTIAAYRRTCATCHGQLGRGDGPQGPMVQARDLSDPAWQAAVTDVQISETIQKGKGRMPPSGLPPETVEGLVHLVRLFDRARIAAPPPGPSSEAPAAGGSASAGPAPPPAAPPPGRNATPPK